ncbi:DUF4142 domain-containing protein [Chondromyces crocatus]|uniref:DUF4142 domain-containing protein n=1 Tax=Chondromyces crocatus TaxID=52 RepID=A0A0K1E5C4_CHOCO|nr:DUF4142 domain-containing protein [Chondromyces crocatus]AKT36060.1 uncharacterized protein CMC5_001730 [Chondromyces crocatus]
MSRIENRTAVARTLASLVGVAAALAVGCAGSQAEPQMVDAMPPEPAMMGTPPTPPPAEEPVAAAEPAPEAAVEAPTPVPTPLSDEQIAAVSEAANASHIDSSKIAQTKAKDARVKKLAATILKHHTEVQKKQAQLLTKAKLVPAESPVVEKLKTDVQSGMTALNETPAADFDKAYIELQVKLHQEALATIDNQLLPNVKNEDLKTLLTELRPKIENHLNEAKEIQTALTPGATAVSSQK